METEIVNKCICCNPISLSRYEMRFPLKARQLIEDLNCEPKPRLKDFKNDQTRNFGECWNNWSNKYPLSAAKSRASIKERKMRIRVANKVRDDLIIEKHQKIIDDMMRRKFGERVEYGKEWDYEFETLLKKECRYLDTNKELQTGCFAAKRNALSFLELLRLNKDHIKKRVIENCRWTGDVDEAMKQLDEKTSSLFQRSNVIREELFLHEVNEFNTWIYKELGSGIGI